MRRLSRRGSASRAAPAPRHLHAHAHASAGSPDPRRATNGAYSQHQLARIYLQVGEREKALDVLDTLLKIPYYLFPGWLRIDPNFASLRGNPRFERLAAGR